MAIKTKDTSILMQRLIQMKAKRDELAKAIDGLQGELMELDLTIEEGINVLLSAETEEKAEEVEVTRVMQR